MRSSTGYFTEFGLPEWFDGPESLRVLIKNLWDQCYSDLYEEACDVAAPLGDAFEQVLAAYATDGGGLGHQRLVWMALAYCSAAAITVNAYLPGDSRPEQVMTAVEKWLRNPSQRVHVDLDAMFAREVMPPQALHESLDVLYQSLLVLEPERALDGLREILDDCIDGHAIIPGSDGRRDLFNWWLLDVVPSSWCLRRPAFSYTIHTPWPPGGVM